MKEIRRGAFGEVLSFWADFEQTCVGATGGLRGEIRYRADVPVLVRAPERLVRPARAPMTFDVLGFAHAGQRVALAAEDLPPGARFADQGDGTGRFAWTPSALDAGRYAPRFGTMDEGGRADSAWTDLEIQLANDDFDGAYVIPSLPFRDAATTLTATRVADDPLILLNAPGPVAFEGAAPRTVAPLLVYTELLLAADRRAREAAVEVGRRYLKALLEPAS